MSNGENNQENEDKRIKIILLGESGVGKTNLIRVFLGYKFDSSSGANSTNSYTLESELVYNKKKYKYYLWDTAGQEIYRSVNKIFIKNAKIILIIYSIINRESFNEVEYWINAVKEALDDNNYIMALVANKSDLYEESLVTEEEGKQMAKKYGMEFILTSALEDIESFKNLVNKLLVNYIETYYEKTIGENRTSITLSVDDFNKKKNKKCCK